MEQWHRNADIGALSNLCRLCSDAEQRPLLQKDLSLSNAQFDAALAWAQPAPVPEVLRVLANSRSSATNLVKQFYEVQGREINIPEKDPELRQAALLIRAIHEGIVASLHRLVSDAAKAGEKLIPIQQELAARGCKGKGFQKWVQENCGFSHTTAYHYMHLYRHSLKNPDLLNRNLLAAYQEAGIIAHGPNYQPKAALPLPKENGKNATRRGIQASPAARTGKRGADAAAETCSVAGDEGDSDDDGPVDEEKIKQEKAEREELAATLSARRQQSEGDADQEEDDEDWNDEEGDDDLDRIHYDTGSLDEMFADLQSGFSLPQSATFAWADFVASDEATAAILFRDALHLLNDDFKDGLIIGIAFAVPASGYAHLLARAQSDGEGCEAQRPAEQTGDGAPPAASTSSTAAAKLAKPSVPALLRHQSEKGEPPSPALIVPEDGPPSAGVTTEPATTDNAAPISTAASAAPVDPSVRPADDKHPGTTTGTTAAESATPETAASTSPTPEVAPIERHLEERSSAASAVLVVPESKNQKTGVCAATYASQATCPPTCPFRNNGCYGELDYCGRIADRLNQSTVCDPTAIALEEARQMDLLVDPLDLRVHVVGDCPNAGSASIIGAAMLRYQARTGKLAWTYTHGWRETPVQAWQRANVMASCEAPQHVKDAASKGYPAALVVSAHSSERAWDIDGFRVVPCPSQTRHRKCVECRLCMRAEKLLKAKIVVSLAAHGSGARCVRRLLENVGPESSKGSER